MDAFYVMLRSDVYGIRRFEIVDSDTAANASTAAVALYPGYVADAPAMPVRNALPV